MAADHDHRCAWLGNGFVHIRDYKSGLEGLYDPQADAMRGVAYEGMLHAAREFVAGE